jgi:hypothetical protein
MKTSKCPNCKSEFETAKARTYPGVARDFSDVFITGRRGYEAPEDQVNSTALVECPECHHQFVSENVRFFGILSPKALKIVLAVYVSAFIFIAIYIIVTGK